MAKIIEDADKNPAPAGENALAALTGLTQTSRLVWESDLSSCLRVRRVRRVWGLGGQRAGVSAAAGGCFLRGTRVCESI